MKMSDGHRYSRATGRVSCKSTELKRCSIIKMHYYYYYYCCCCCYKLSTPPYLAVSSSLLELAARRHQSHGKGLGVHEELN